MADGNLKTSQGTSVRLENVTRALVTGIGLDNTFNVSLWTGEAVLTGGLGNDRVVSARDTSHVLSDGQLIRGSGGNITLSGIRFATLAVEPAITFSMPPALPAVPGCMVALAMIRCAVALAMITWMVGQASMSSLATAATMCWLPLPVLVLRSLGARAMMCSMVALEWTSAVAMRGRIASMVAVAMMFWAVVPAMTFSMAAR